MAKTYAQVVKQIETLSREAEKLKRKEVDGVISRIKEAIEVYGLTAADLGLPADGRVKGGSRAASKTPGGGKAAKRKPAKARLSATPKFRDEAGHIWVGRGPRPQWLRDALASGKQLSDFAV